MNQSEQVAFRWLQSRGYSGDDIVFRANQTPDFLTPDGASYEVKLLYGKAIRFTAGQVDRLLEETNARVVIVKRDQVVADFPAGELVGSPRTVREFTVSYIEAYRTTKLEEVALKELRETMEEAEFVGRGNIPPELDLFLNGGINQSAVIRAGLHELRKTWKQAKEDLERRRAGER